MFFPLFLLVFVGTLSVGMAHGPRAAVARGWLPAAFLLPVWMQAGVGSMVLDLRTAAGFGVLLALILKPPPGWLRITLADGLILALVMVQIISQHSCGSLRPLTAPEILRKWLLPYLAGRTLLGSTNDIRAAIPGILRVVVALAFASMFECVTKVNVINTLLGKTYGLLEQGEGYRWGMKRAHVLFDHPIFFGLGLVLLLPWAIEARRQAKAGTGPKWWRRMPLLMAAALFATVSRGPQIAGIATGMLYLFFRHPKIRIPFLLFALIGGTVVYGAKDQVVELLSVVAGEKGADEEVRIIFIDGEEFEYTGTNHRILLFKVYADPVDQAGLCGFGSELKGVEIEECNAQRFGSIDCHYLLFLLQHGKLGLGAFLILTLSTLLSLARLAWNPARPEAGLAAGLFGALLGVTVSLGSVWFSQDFGGIWLFTIGLAGRLHLLTPSEIPLPASPRTETPSRSRLACAHAPLRPLKVQASP